MVVAIACGDDRGGTTGDECTAGLVGCRVSPACVSGTSNCAPVPPEVLHDGEFSGPSGTSFIGLMFYKDQPL